MYHLTHFRLPAVAFLLMSAAIASHETFAVTVLPDEMLEAHRFVTAAFEGAAPAMADQPGLTILANFDSVQKNNRFGKPLKLAGKTFAHGLFCHATEQDRGAAAGARQEVSVGNWRRFQRADSRRPWQRRLPRFGRRQGCVSVRRAQGRDAHGLGERRPGRRADVSFSKSATAATESVAIRPTGPTRRSRWPTVARSGSMSCRRRSGRRWRKPANPSSPSPMAGGRRRNCSRPGRSSVHPGSSTRLEPSGPSFIPIPRPAS